MEFRVRSYFSPLADIDERDARDIAVALNHLGYYRPDPRTGIVPFDPGYDFFNAIKKFQNDHGLFPDGALRPGGETERGINMALRGNEQSGRYYVWRTARDGRVRPAHAAREGQVFRRDEDLPGGHPGEDFNCRCWAEPLYAGYTPPPLPQRKPEAVVGWPKLTPRQKELMETAQKWLDRFENRGHILSKKFLMHYLDKTGTLIELTETDMKMFTKEMKKNERRFEDNITEKYFLNYGFTDTILKIKNGEAIVLNKNKNLSGDYWDQDIQMPPWRLFFNLTDKAYSIGSVKLRSWGSFKVSRSGNVIEIEGVVEHTIQDIYNFDEDNVIDRFLFSDFREMATQNLAKPFPIRGSKIKILNATLEIKNDKLVANKNSWQWKSMEK